jgi:ribulose-phosphate 3-epimerase
MFGSVQIAPSILSADFAALGKDVAEVAAAGADWIHVDVMDGHFVPNLTIGPGHVTALKKITDVPLDVHLMIDNPEVQVPWYLEAGADLVTVHFEACKNVAKVLKQIRESGAKAGISINPETPANGLESLVGLADMILIMSVHPGFGGQSFIEDSPAKIAQIAGYCIAADANPLIEVDGGINSKTAPLCTAVGADVLVAGNAIFGQSDRAVALKEIRNACF